jgi:transposase
MANKKIDMSKLRQMLRLYAQGESKLKISNLTGVSRNTLKKYLKIYDRLGFTSNDIEQKGDQELDNLFGDNLLPEPSDRYKALEEFFPRMEKELKKRGATRLALWTIYIALHPDGFKVSQFKSHYRKWLIRSKPVMHMEHIAGDKMYIDYAGEKLHIVNEESGEITDVEVFIAILGASQLTYIEATLSQRKEDFITSCEHALAYYGGVPLAIVPDNLKSAVTKSDRFEPTLNQVFENFASHYSTTILPARAYKPKDKALVEGAVKIAYQRVYSVLDARVFHSLDELNIAIKEILEVHNNTKLTGRPDSRRDLYEAIERCTLNPLPVFPFEFKRQQHATIAVNGHVCLKEDKHYYSVPYHYIGKKVKLLYTSDRVEIFYNYASLALHQRNRRAYGYTTDIEHLASTHKYLTQWNPERFIKWAQTIGDPVKEFIILLMDSKTHPEQSYKACQGVLGYERKVGRERLINACKRAMEFENYSYNVIKLILVNHYDQLTSTEIAGELPLHENIRGENYYK